MGQPSSTPTSTATWRSAPTATRCGSRWSAAGS